MRVCVRHRCGTARVAKWLALLGARALIHTGTQSHAGTAALQAERQAHRRALVLRTRHVVLRLRRLRHALAAVVAHVRGAHGDSGGLALRGNKAEHL